MSQAASSPGGPAAVGAGGRPTFKAGALRLLKVGAFTVLGFAALIAGIVLLVNGISDGAALPAIAGGITLAVLVAWVARTVLRSRSLQIAQARSDTVVCRTCGPFPLSAVVVVPPAPRTVLLRRGLSVVLLAAAAASMATGSRNLFIVPASFLVLWGLNAWILSREPSRRCPTCKGTRIASSRSPAGMRWTRERPAAGPTA